MSHVYEVVDSTDDEMYFTIGIYSTLELALAALDQPNPPETFHCHGDWGYAEFEVRRRPLNAYSEHGRTAASVTWKSLPLEDDDYEEQWEREVTLTKENTDE